MEEELRNGMQGAGLQTENKFVKYLRGIANLTWCNRWKAREKFIKPERGWLLILHLIGWELHELSEPILKLGQR